MDVPALLTNAGSSSCQRFFLTKPRSTVTSRFTRIASATALALSAGLLLSACQPSASGEEPEVATPEATSQSTVMITDNHGEVEVPVNPERVVALDNTIFDTLSDWGVELVAAPKQVMGDGIWPEYTENDDIADIGSHREPNLELIVAAEPDLIIGGYRFSSHYDDIKAQNPDAVIIEIAPRDGEDEFSELKRQTEILGQIFDHEDEAAALNSALDTAMADAAAAYDPSQTVMAVNTSGGKIGYLAPGVGRALGPVFEPLGLTPALEIDGATDDHQGDEISVEAIADSNPDWIIALDRDASMRPEARDESYAPAQELIAESEALKNVPAVVNDQIIILDSNFYLTDGIQAYTALFEQIAEAFQAA